MLCKKCGRNNFEVRQANSKTGLYCKDCGAWNKWLSNKERNEYYKEEMAKSMNRGKVARSFTKRGEISIIKCGSCGCQLYNSKAPNPIGQFNLLYAKFCPQCGIEFL